MLETVLSRGDRYHIDFFFFWRLLDRELLNFNINSVEFKTFQKIFLLNKNASLKQKDLKAHCTMVIFLRVHFQVLICLSFNTEKPPTQFPNNLLLIETIDNADL